jgi:hypothetical protein
MKRLRKFLQLSRFEQLLLIKTTFVLAVVVLGLRVLPWLTLQRLLLKQANLFSCFTPARRPAEQHIAWAIKTASRSIPRATCLPQAVAAQFLLIRNAYPADLQIGVGRKENGQLEAHAWVLSNTGIIAGGIPDLDHFVPLSNREREEIENYARAF